MDEFTIEFSATNKTHPWAVMFQGVDVGRFIDERLAEDIAFRWNNEAGYKVVEPVLEDG